MCPDQGSNHNPGLSGWCSNQLSNPGRAELWVLSLSSHKVCKPQVDVAKLANAHRAKVILISYPGVPIFFLMLAFSHYPSKIPFSFINFLIFFTNILLYNFVTFLSSTNSRNHTLQWPSFSRTSYELARSWGTNSQFKPPQVKGIFIFIFICNYSI